MAITPTVVEPPARLPAPFGLFTALTFRPDSDRWINGVRWQGASVGPAAAFTSEDCGDDVPDGAFLPEGRTAPWLESLPRLTVTGEYDCTPVGLSGGDVTALATQDLILHEEEAVGAWLWGTVQAMKPKTVPGGDLPVVTARLEHVAAARFGRGIILAPYAVAALMAATGVAEVKGQTLQTKLGTPVVGVPSAGDGFTVDGAMLVIPQLVAYRSPIAEVGDTDHLFDRGHNVLRSVVTRDYVLGLDTALQPAAAPVTTF